MRGAAHPERISETESTSSRSTSTTKVGYWGKGVLSAPLAEIPPWRPPTSSTVKKSAVSNGDKNFADTRSERLPRIGETAAESEQSSYVLSGRASTNSEARRYRRRTLSLPKPPPSPFAPYAFADFSVPMPRVIQEVRLSTEGMRLGMDQVAMQGAALKQAAATVLAKGDANSSNNNNHGNQVHAVSVPDHMPGTGSGVSGSPATSTAHAAKLGATAAAAGGGPGSPLAQQVPDRSASSKGATAAAGVATAQPGAAATTVTTSGGSAVAVTRTSASKQSVGDRISPSDRKAEEKRPDSPSGFRPSPGSSSKAKSGGGIFSSLLCCMRGRGEDLGGHLDDLGSATGNVPPKA